MFVFSQKGILKEHVNMSNQNITPFPQRFCGYRKENRNKDNIEKILPTPDFQSFLKY